VAQRYDWREQMRMWEELIRQPEEIDKRRIGRRAGRGLLAFRACVLISDVHRLD
jgi:hypothetical protein